MTTEQKQIANAFAAKMAAARKRLGYSYYELMKRSGVHSSLLIRIESGENTPRLDTAIRICEALHMQLILEREFRMT